MRKITMKTKTRVNLTRRGAQKGAVLVAGLLMTTVLAIVAVNASKRTVVQQRMANNYRFSIEAMNNAETGFRSALTQINDQTLILNGFDDELDPNGDGVFDDRFSLTLTDPNSNVSYKVVLVDDDDGDANPSVDANGIVRLMSQGISNVGSTRTIEVRIADTDGGGGGFSLDKAIITEGDLTISGNPELIGDNPDIHSNADIDISGNPTTAGGLVSAVGSVTVSGTPAGGTSIESGAGYIDIPDIIPSTYAEYADYTFESDGKIYDANGVFVFDADGNEWQGWKFAGEKWDTSGPNVQGGFLYFTGEYGNVVLSSNPGSPGNPLEITILADGYIEIAGNPILTNYMDPDDPPDVQAIMFMAGTDIKINGNPNQTYNGIIAAAEQIDVSGNPSIEGVLIAGDESNDSDLVVANSISGNMDLTYSGGLSLGGDEGADDGIAVVLSWQDQEIARDSGVFAL